MRELESCYLPFLGNMQADCCSFDARPVMGGLGMQLLYLLARSANVFTRDAIFVPVLASKLPVCVVRYDFSARRYLCLGVDRA